jgi:tetratricopeptide (TPR) repeat protein
MSVTLPFIFLILDAWPLNKIKTEIGRAFLEKVPFILFSLLAGWVTLQAQSQYGAVPTLQELPLDYRLMNALHSIVFYLLKMLLPMNLSVLYPIVLKKTYSLEYVAFAWLVLMIFLACFTNRKERPYLSMAWIFYLILLVPVLGLQYVGNQAAADRFTYLPSLGPFLLVACWASSSLSNRRVLLYLSCGIITLLLGIGTVVQLSIWKNSVGLWERVVQVASPYIYDSIYEHLGDAYFSERRWEEAMGAYNTALAMTPSNYGLHEKKGIIFINKGLPAQAANEFGQELASDPKNAMGHRYLYMANQKMGRFDAALTEVQTAIQLDPNLPGVYNSLGAVYFSMKKYALASAAFGIAHQKDPQNLDCLMNGAAADSFAGNWDGALQSLQAAVSLRPDNPDIYQKLGQVYEKKGDRVSAQAAYIAGQKLAINNK